MNGNNASEGGGVFPAYAGVILRFLQEKLEEQRLSRIRGGDPVPSVIRDSWEYVFPAYAGVILHLHRLA